MQIRHDNLRVQREGPQVRPIVILKNCIKIGVTFFFCKYIASTFAVTQYLYWRKRSKTLITLFIKSVPLKHWLLKLMHEYFAAQSNTITIFPGFAAFTTRWWGTYHTEQPFIDNSFSITNSA